jgi:hypothetical protein
MNNCQVRVRQTVPMSEIAFDAERRRLTVGAWSARATWVRSSLCPRADGAWSALLGLRRGVNLLVNADQDNLPALVETLRATPDVSANPRRGETWWGEFAGGYPVVP